MYAGAMVRSQSAFVVAANSATFATAASWPRRPAPGCFLAVLGDQPAVDPTMLRRHLASRVTGSSRRHAGHLEDSERRPACCRCHESADTAADHDDIDDIVTR